MKKKKQKQKKRQKRIHYHIQITAVKTHISIRGGKKLLALVSTEQWHRTKPRFVL
jgi:ribosomal protein L32